MRYDVLFYDGCQELFILSRLFPRGMSQMSSSQLGSITRKDDNDRRA